MSTSHIRKCHLANFPRDPRLETEGVLFCGMDWTISGERLVPDLHVGEVNVGQAVGDQVSSLFPTERQK